MKTHNSFRKQIRSFKYAFQIGIAVLLLSLPGSIALGQTESASISLPLPLLTLSQLPKEAKEEIGMLQELLKKGDLVEFYDKAGAFLKRKRMAQLKTLQIEAETREEAMAFEWVCFLVATAPFLDADVSKIFGGSPKMDIIQTKLYLKEVLLNNPYGNDERGRSLRRLHKQRTGTEYVSLFSEKELEQIRTAHVEYFIHLFQAATIASRAAIEAREKVQRPSAQYSKLSSINSNFNTMKQSWRGQLVMLLVRSFPNDGAKIRNYIKKAGFTSDLECVQLLEEVFTRTSKTEYLFSGLPDARSLKKYRTEKEIDKIERGKLESKMEEFERVARYKLGFIQEFCFEMELQDEINRDAYKDAKSLQRKKSLLESTRERREEITKYLEENAKQMTLEDTILRLQSEIKILSKEKQLELQDARKKLPSESANSTRYLTMLGREIANLEKELNTKLIEQRNNPKSNLRP